MEMSYSECWDVLNKLCVDVHWDCYKKSKERRKRECYAIGKLIDICQRADREQMEKKEGGAK